MNGILDPKLRLETKRLITERGCWVWTGYKDRYGITKHRGKLSKVHRLSWEIYKGPIPDGMQVLHECDNPPCFNPDHLFLGTQLDNIMDCVRKGRSHTPYCPPEKKARGASNGMRTHPGLVSGEKNPKSKLSDVQRMEIYRRRMSGEKRKDLAKEFGVHETSIRHACEYCKRTYP